VAENDGRQPDQTILGRLHAFCSSFALPFGLYLILAIVATYPLIRHFGTHVPGSATWAFDEYTFVYNLWWFKHALLDLGVNPLYSSYIWVPVGINFVLYTYTLFNAAVALPLLPAIGLVAASNALMLFSIAMSGFAAYLLARYLLRGRPGAPWIAFVAGLIYAFAANRFVYLALGHYDMVSTEWLPLFTLFFLKTLRQRRWINPILAGLFAAFAMLCEMIFGVFLALLALILFAFEVGHQQAHRRGAQGAERVRGLANMAARLGALIVTAGLVYAPVLLAIVREMSKGYILSGWGDAVRLSADLVGLVTPAGLNALLGRDWSAELAAVRQGTAQFSDVNTVVIGWGVLILALLAGLLDWRRAKAWAVTALTFGVLSLGPLLQINGRTLFDFDGVQTSFPLPFILMHYLPIAKGNRAPNRHSVILLLALAVLVALALAWLWERLAKTRRAGRLAPALSIVIAGLLLIEHVAVPLPLTDARPPAFYAMLAQEPNDFTILTLPLGWRDSFGALGAEDTRTQYYQTAHAKRLLSGNSGRHEPAKTEYYAGIPFFKALTDLELYQPVSAAVRTQAAAQGPALAYLYDLRYVVVHPPVPGRPPYSDTWSAAERFVLETLPVEQPPIYDADGLRAYAVRQPPAQDGFAVDAGAAGWEPYRGEGWHANEEIVGRSAAWAGAEGARLFLPLRDAQARTLRLTLAPFDYPGAPAQTVAVSLNGHSLGAPLALTAGWAEYAWDAPAETQLVGLNTITLRFGRLATPRAVLPAQRAIGSSGVETPLDIEVNSSDAFAYITLGDGKGQQDGSEHRRGYNIAILDAETGAIVRRAAFDTAANAYEAAGMADFLAAAPPGSIVVVAKQGDGARFLTDAAIAGLRSIGSGIDPRQDAGRAHALVGVRGAPAGSAAEVWQAGNAWLRLGGNVDARPLAAALDGFSLK
jgi:hypothetical protein